MTDEPAPLPDFAALAPDRRAELERVLATIDLRDTASVLAFGSASQQRLTAVADQMLEGVRAKDAGAAGTALSTMLASLRGLTPGGEPGLLRRLLGAAPAAARILQQYEQVKGQVEAAGDRLEADKTRLMRDIIALDTLYAETLGYFRELADWIAAGEELIRRTDAETIPAAEVKAGGADVLAAQALRDLRAARDALERRVHDLKLTRQVAMQALPSIRLIQENDKALVEKITSVIANTVPLWRQQLAQAVALSRMADAGRHVQQASDLTNTLLRQGADNLRTANAQVRGEMERGIVDVDTLKQANAQLIATIEDSLRIADEGKARRRTAEAALQESEAALKKVLAAARAPAAPPPESAGST